MCFDNLQFCKFVFNSVFNFSYVNEIELKFFHCVSLMLHRNITELCAFSIGWPTKHMKSWSCIGLSCSRSLIVSLSHFFVILLNILGSFWRIHLSKSCDQSILWVRILCSAAGVIVSKTMIKLISTKKRDVITLVGHGESGKSQIICQWLKSEIFQPMFDKILFFHQHFQPLHDVLLKEVINIETFQRVNFDFFDSL